MMTNRFTILAICLAVGLGTVADQAMAKKKRNNNSSSDVYDHPSGKGYPNGRPWQALEYDFEIVKHKLNVLDYKVDDVKEDTETIIEQLDDVQSDIDAIETEIADIKDGVGEILEEVDDLDDDVSMLKNTLSVDVSVGPATDNGITLYVQVAQNGVGVTMLPANAFKYFSSFPTGAAEYCGAACFTVGSRGVYMIELLVGSEPGTYAGALEVSMEVVDDDDDDDDDGPEIANGTALVSFEVEDEPIAQPL
jgi:uncharacterized protein YoxC